LPNGIELPNLTLSARYRAVGNAVPLNMAKALANAILSATPAEKIRLCGCGCGREITRRATYAIPACRKREQRRRETVTDQVKKTA
jgi:DNA (cytosine-5)-methyltransferase 1